MAEVDRQPSSSEPGTTVDGRRQKETVQSDLPLAGVRVIDISASYAGPVMTMYLGDLGADVIKIERPGEGDDCRAWGPPFLGTESAWFLAANRNKRSVSLDLLDARGHAALLRLLATADVFVENMNPGKLEALSLAPGELRERFPRLIYCAFSGFGLDGPHSRLPGYDLIAQARSGLMSVTGSLGGEPQRVSTALSDIVAGLVGALATTAALHRQAKTGIGEVVDVSLLQAALALMSPRVTSYLAGEPEPAPSGATDSVLSIYQSFPTSDRPIVVAIGNDAMWRRFCGAIGAPELASNPEYATNEFRRAHRAALVEAITRQLRTKPSDAWLTVLGEASVPCSLVSSLSEVVQDPQLRAREALLTLDIPEIGGVTLVDSPWRFGLTGGTRRHDPPPKLGSDTIDVLREANFAEDELRSLLEDGVVWSPSAPVS